jgi:hypothetical protein
MMRKDVSGGQRSTLKKSEKMMRKDLLGGQRSKFKKSKKMMRKDVSGGQRSKFKKSEKMMRKDFQESLLEFFFVIDALAHSPISANSLISLMTEK